MAEVVLDSEKIINFDDAKKLILCILADWSFLPWATVKMKTVIEKCVVIHVPGMDVLLWEQYKTGALNSWHGLFGDPITTIVNHPTTTAVQSVASLLKVSVPSKTKEGRGGSNNRPKKRQKNRQSSPCSYEQLTATQDQLMDYGFPLRTCPSTANRGYVTTPTTSEKAHFLVALDCEMCETARGSELTRLSLVDERGAVLIDELVKPFLPITDYRTQYSGIDRNMLADVKTTLSDAQALFCRFVSKDTILVGHSLENDLAALEIFHERVIDTCMIYPHSGGFPRRCSLKRLAKHFLGKNIQDGAHDSVEDARIALELLKLKKEEGLEFGIPTSKPMHLAKLMDVLSERKRVCCMIDRPECIEKHSAAATHTIPCLSDVSVSQKLVSQLKKNHDFIWAQFQGLYRFYIARNAVDKESSGPEDEVNEVLEELDRTIQQVYDEAPANTLIMISTAHGDTSLAIKMQSDRARRQAGLDHLPSWTEADEANWAALTNRVVQGLLFAIVKGS